jgi:hypothetical protein
MASTAVRLVIDDPENFHLLTTDMKEQIIKGGIATVNVQAALTRRYAIENVKADFTLRNNFTTSQIRFDPMPQGRYALSAIHSTIGITERAGYMARQESGGEHKPESGKTLAIPTNQARAGGSKGAPVLKNYRVSSLKRQKVKVNFSGNMENASSKYKQVMRAAAAFNENKLIQYGGNLHFVKDFRSNSSRVSFRLQQVYSFDKEETETRANPWLEPAYLKVAQDGENIFISQMRKLGM